MVGGALIGWGVVLFLDATPDLARRINFAAWALGLNVVHDAVAVPVVLGVGALLGRVARRGWRAPLQAALLATGVVLAVAAPPLLRTADVSRNPTIQPLHYPSATLTVLAVVWASVLAWGAVGQLRRRGSPDPAGRIR